MDGDSQVIHFFFEKRKGENYRYLNFCNSKNNTILSEMSIYASIPGLTCSSVSSEKKSHGFFKQKFSFSLKLAATTCEKVFRWQIILLFVKNIFLF